MLRLSHKYKGVPVYYSTKEHRNSNSKTEVVAEARPFRITVYDKDSLHDAEVLEHEYTHVEQMKRYGLIGFALRNIVFGIVDGYKNNPLEIEARTAALKVARRKSNKSDKTKK